MAGHGQGVEALVEEGLIDETALGPPEDLRQLRPDLPCGMAIATRVPPQMSPTA